MTHASSNTDYSWARAFRDIGVHAINTGQFPFFCLFIIALLFLYRLPAETLSILSTEILANFKNYALSGYSLFVVTLLCVAIYVIALTKRHKEQLGKQNQIIEKLKEDLRASITSTGGIS